MKKILYYLKEYYFSMCIGLFIKFTGTIMDLLIPSVLARMIDDVAPSGNIPAIFIWGGVMIICALTAVICNIAANRMAAKAASGCTEKLRRDLFKKISYLSCRQTDTVSVPSLISRVTSDTYNVHQVVGSMQRLGVRAPILLVGGIMVTMTLEPALTMALVAALPLLTLAVYWVSKKGIPLYAEAQKSTDALVRKAQEYMTGVRVIKALSKSEYEKSKFDEVNSDVVKKEQKAGIVMSVTNPVMNLLLNCGLTSVIIIGAFRVNAGATQTGKIIAFLSYFTLILQAMMSITRMFVMFSKGAASAERIAEVLDMEEDIKPTPEDYTESARHIVFKNVSFSYNKARDNISDVSFSLKKGETLGIIGPTGSGKTTVINLLLRLYDADSGEIRINGMNITGIPDDVLHKKFGIAFQNDFLTADSIKENIAFGRDICDDDINAAAASAQAKEFIDAADGGFSYKLTVKGANLSGGQKQRLLIARALAGKPEILILDDSSSALDYKTDAELRKAIRRDFKDTTAIIISQRISSIMNADHIMMLEEGKCTGYGTHEELLETSGAYREINEIQMGAGIYE